MHMESDFGAEDYFDNAKPVIIFDKDLDATERIATWAMTPARSS